MPSFLESFIIRLSTDFLDSCLDGPLFFQYRNYRIKKEHSKRFLMDYKKRSEVLLTTKTCKHPEMTSKYGYLLPLGKELSLVAQDIAILVSSATIKWPQYLVLL